MKKILISLILIGIFIFFNCNVFGIAVHTNEPITYMTAYDTETTNLTGQKGDQKAAYYGMDLDLWNTLMIQNRYINGEYQTQLNQNLNHPGNKITTSWFRMYIFRQILNGQLAYCLDPGKSVAPDYTLVNELQENFRDASVKNKLYATIYYTDFSKYDLGSVYSTSQGQISVTNFGDVNEDYIIKQILMWICEAGHISYSGSQINITTSPLSSPQTLYADVYNAILHYKQKLAGGVASANINKVNDNVNNNNLTWFNTLITALTNTYNTLYNLNPEIEIAKYTPTNGNTDDYQEFIGVYVKKQDPSKYYAVIHKKDGIIVSNSSSWIKLNNDVTVNPNTYDGYELGSIEIYESHEDYGIVNTITKVDVSEIINDKNNYTLVKKNASEYNVIVFNYDEEPATPGKVTVKKYYRTATGSVKLFESDVINLSTNNTTKVSFKWGRQAADDNGDGNADYFYCYRYTDSKLGIERWHNSIEYKKDSDNNQVKLSVTYPVSKNNESYTLKIYYGVRYIYFRNLLVSGNSYTTISTPGKTRHFSDFEKKTINAETDGYGSKTDNAQENLSGNIIRKNNKYIKLEKIDGKHLTQKKWTNSIKSNTRKNGTSLGKTKTFTPLTALTARTAPDYTLVEFYYNEVISKKVIVRHFVKGSDGKYTLDNSIANDKAVIKNGQAYGNRNKNDYFTIPNYYSQRKSVYNNSEQKLNANERTALVGKKFNYSELYEIGESDIIKIDRSRTLIKNGYIYNCDGVATTSANSYKNTLNTAPSNSTLRQIINGSSASEYTYIDYYYSKESYSPNVDSIGTTASLKFESKTKSGNSYISIGGVIDGIAYCPASENLKPYVETSKYKVKDIVYDISIGTNENGSEVIVYNLGESKIWTISNDTTANVTSNNLLGSELNKVYNNNISMSLNDGVIQYKTEVRDLITHRGRCTNIFDNIASTSNEKFKNLCNTISSYTVTESNYKDSSSYDVPSNKYNGYRTSAGTVNYKICDLVHGIYESTQTYTIPSNKCMPVNIYTPMKLAEPKIESTGDMVNHSSNIDNNQVIQKDTQFTFTPQIDSSAKLGYNSNLPGLGKYLKGYYVIFDFDIRKSDGTTVAAKTPIWVVNGGSITATPINSSGESSVKQLEEKITTVAVTINASDDLRSKAFGDIDKAKAALEQTDVVANTNTSMTTDTTKNDYEQYGINMLADSHYFVRKTTSTYVLARLYDFKITDCYDVNFKNVFRKSETNTVNDLTGVCYYSGIRKLLIHAGNNILYNRKENTILPLGPYKHTQYDYVKAPKLGYRISFDVKTYGYYDNKSTDSTRTVRITPSYYYISKDGKTFNDNVKLYYKNSSGKYVTFNQSSYNISFKPNDGYRYIENIEDTPNLTNLSDKLVNINVGKYFDLKADTMMSTSSDNFVQAWYGEYKVPNSTIVIPAEGGNINNPLTDGYLGVKFKIECIDKSNTDSSKSVTILYDVNDKTKENTPNTSQWDYEGYMGVASGNNFSGSLQLEKGTWSIDNNLYQKIKGTVVLYDLDERAANDFE